MMLDTDVVAASPLSVYRVLSDAGLIKRHNTKASLKETSFQQPLAPHEHWHVDIAYINVSDVETIIQRAQESYPGVSPRIISNGAQFIARDFKEFIRICGMTHVRTSPYYPQSNSKIERWYRSIKSECIRPGTPLSVEDAVCLIDGYVQHYNDVRLHSAIGYVTPADKMYGRDKRIFADRDRKLDEAKSRRQAVRAQQRQVG
jgi:putative transposase